jgi:3-hydroxyacyl-CoA dehydrogenase
LEDHGLLQKGRAGEAGKRIRSTTDLAEALENADYIQESVPDDYATKKSVFKEMDAAAASDTILASSRFRLADE